MNKRTLQLKKYGIGHHRYAELRAFCRQYPDWKVALLHETDTVKSPIISDMPLAKGNAGDPTEKLAEKRLKLQEKVDIIEGAAQLAADDLSGYLIRNVCYGENVNYLITVREMPCSAKSFYDKRRYFFYLLDGEK